MSMQSGGVPPYSNNVPPRYIRGRGRADPMQMPRGGGYRGNHHITTGPGGMNIAHTTGQQGLITMPIPPRVGLQQPTSMAQGRQVLIPHQQQQPPTHQPSQHVLLPNPNPHVLTQAGLRYIPSGLHVPSMYPPGVPSNFATGTPQLFLPQGQFMPPNAGQPINLQPPQAQLPLTQPQAFSAGNSSATTARPLATRKKNPIRIVNPDTGVEVSLTAENPAPVAPPVSVVVPAASVGVPSNETSSNSGTSGVPEDFKRKVFSTIQNHEDAANQQPVAPPLFQVPAPPPPPPNALIRHPDSLKNGSKVEAEAGVGDDRPIVPGPQVAFVATVAASTAAVETVITEKSKITNESETIAPPSTQAEPLPAAPQVAPESSSSKPESVAASTAIASETIDDVAVPTTAATVLPPEPPTEILEGKKETVSQEQRTAVEVPEEPVKPEGAEQSQPEKPVEPVISEKESRLEAEEIVEETEDSPQTEEKDVEILTAESAATPQENGGQEAAPTGESSAEPPSEVVSSLNGEEGSVKAEVSLEVPAAPEPEEIAPETETSEKKEIKPEESSRAEPAVEEAGQGPSVPEVTEQKDLAEGKPKTEPRISKSLPEAEPVDKPAQAVPETEPAVRTVAPVESDLVSKVEKKPEPEVSKPVSQPPEPVKPEKQDTKTEEVVVNSIPHHQSPPPQPHPHIPPPPQPSQSGRTMYDRNFLLAFKGMEVCKTVPEELQNTECFKPFAYKDQPPMDISSSRDVFVPFGQGGGGRGRRGRGSEPKRIMHQPLRVEKVELHKAATPWQRTTEDAAELSEKEKATQELYRKFQGILNKLTPQKFQSLAEQALQLDISSEERLRGVIDKIFTKALEEPSFSIAYANLCKVLSPVKVDWTAPDGKPRSTNFRRVLLTKCQQEFEKDKKDDENREQMLKAIEEADTPEKKKELEVELATFETKNRRRSLGNIRFIGELFKLHMLSATIMHECVIRLLRSTSDEESLECFARLITTTGKDLDVAQAKPRIDNYFSRIDDIIKKSKVPARIKFMLQDVQELRSHKWVPRSGQDNTLKTIDQIHAEARAEAEMTKQMVVQHQMSSMKGGGGRGGDDRRKGRDSKPSHDEWTKVEKEKKQQPPVKADISRIRTMMMKKSKEPTLGPPGTVGLRPVWGGRGTAASMATLEAAKAEREKEREPAGSKHTRPGRSSSSGQKRSDKERERDRERDRAPSGRGSSSGPKRSHTFPDNQEKQSAIQTLKEITTAKPPMQKAAAPAQAVQPVAPADTLDEATIARKSCTIVNELSQNNDFKEAMECVKEMQSSGLMHVFVRDSITHSLEQSSHARKCLGRLFPMLVKEGLVSQEKLVAGLNEVLEYAEDYEIDIPKVWDYIGELLAPSVLQSSLSLPALTGVPSSLTDTGKTAILVAKTLHQCSALGSESDTSDLWSQSQLQWSSLGVKSEDVEEFLSRQKLEFLQAGGPSQSSTPQAPPPYLQDLARLFGASDTTNDDIFDWIEKNCAQEDVETPQFIRTLTTAVVQATVSGSGTSAIFQDERFNKRMIVLKKYVNMQKDLQLEVLYALQIAVAKLEHPPKILNGMFNQAYDVEVVGEESCYRWRDKGTENFGKGNAVQSVKSFFEWLESAETESDGEGTT